MNLASVESIYEMERGDEVFTLEQAEELEFLMITQHHFGGLKTTLTEMFTTIIQLLEVFTKANWKLRNLIAEVV